MDMVSYSDEMRVLRLLTEKATDFPFVNLTIHGGTQNLPFEIIVIRGLAAERFARRRGPARSFRLVR
jgi:hypothetical protein